MEWAARFEVESFGKCLGGVDFNIFERRRELRVLIPAFGAMECFEILNPVPGSE